MANVTRDPYSGALIYQSTPEEERVFKERQETKSLVRRVKQLEEDYYELKKILLEKGILG